MNRWPLTAGLLWLTLSAPAAQTASSGDPHMLYIDTLINAHLGQSGVYVLEKGEEALLARAWLADHARESIDVQYFIWSTDTIGILAAEALLRAADRGIHVRVIVDDLLIDAPDKSLLALAKHPNIEIRIYNPKFSVGTTLKKRIFNVVANFRGVNQRMHDKTFILDSKVAITGGRNMADEYYNYDKDYNFRDRDVLLLGEVVKTMCASFESFWQDKLTVSTEKLYSGLGIVQKHVRVDAVQIQAAYRSLHDFAKAVKNTSPEVQAALDAAPSAFPDIANQLVWGKVAFVSDLPGKNDSRFRLDGGGLTTEALAKLVRTARKSIVIQSPYVVLSDKAFRLLRHMRKLGVRVRISTNSLASTDNLMAFGGYLNQRDELLAMGIEIYEYKPYPEIERRLMQRLLPQIKGKMPVFALHAKTLIVDSQIAYVGTYNFDPRSENLNTEVGVIIRNADLASAIEAAVLTDMLPSNSWNAGLDDPDRFASLGKRSKVRLWQFLPVKPLL